MSVVTVTLNPALDLTVRVDELRVGCVNLARDPSCRAGGKGVNVAARLAEYGVRVTASGLLGADNPRRFEQLFRDLGVDDAFVRVPGETRTNIKIVDLGAHETTDLNLPGRPPPADAIAELGARLAKFVLSHEVFVLAGSVPPGVPADLYAGLTRDLRLAGRAVVVDTSGDALAAALGAAPTIVKPNIHELSAALGRSLPGEQDVLAAARELVARGIELVVVSMGARGAMFVTATEAVIARPPLLEVGSTVGAGDAMVAGLVAARLEGLDLVKTAQLATAFSLTALRGGGPGLEDRTALLALARRVSAHSLLPVA